MKTLDLCLAHNTLRVFSFRVMLTDSVCCAKNLQASTDSLLISTPSPLSETVLWIIGKDESPSSLNVVCSLGVPVFQSQ